MMDTAEKELIEAYKLAIDNAKRCDDEAKEAKKIKTDAEVALINYLEAKGAVATGKYDGLGFVRIMQPIVRATCTIENQEKLFEYLKEIGREEVIKQSVHPSTLSSIVKETLENNEPIPDFIGYFLQQTVRLYP